MITAHHSFFQKRTLLKALALLILISGLTCAGYIFFAAESNFDPLGYDRFASKTYIHDLKVIGGNFAVLTAEFSQWLENLWHGKSLAIIVGLLSLLMAGLVWFFGSSDQTDRS